MTPLSGSMSLLHTGCQISENQPDNGKIALYFHLTWPRVMDAPKTKRCLGHRSPHSRQFQFPVKHMIDQQITVDSPMVREAAVRAIGEDRGPCDITTMVFTPENVQTRGRILVKESGILAGIPIAQRVFIEQDVQLKVYVLAEDGSPLIPGQSVMEISGNLGSILTAERSALNFLQHLSGIATLTARFIEVLQGTKCRILDTRKTTPGLRHLEKYAVRCGGGTNHRYGLYDMFLVKDNHFAAYGAYADRTTLTQAIAKAREFDPDAKIEFEADTLKQVELFAELGIDRILLDNMTLEETASAVRLVNGRCELEASGNMTLDRIRKVADTGVDFISVGALTHSVKALDFSLEILPP